MIVKTQPHWLSSGITGPLIADDAGTVSHVVFNGSALVDRFGNAWTQNGAVPQVARSGKTPAGAGAFSDVNYYSGIANGPTDFAGDFSVACVFSVTSALGAGTPVLFCDGDNATAGWFLLLTSASARITIIASAVVTANAPVVGSLNVLYAGRVGTQGRAKLNLGVMATGVVGTTAATAVAATIGRFSGAGLPFSQGIIHEFWASSTGATDALGTALNQRVHDRAGVTAW